MSLFFSASFPETLYSFCGFGFVLKILILLWGIGKFFMPGGPCGGCEARACCTLLMSAGLHDCLPFQGAGHGNSGSCPQSHSPVSVPRSFLWALPDVIIPAPSYSLPAAHFSACNPTILTVHLSVWPPSSQKKTRFIRSVSLQQISQVTPPSSPNTVSATKKETLQVNKSPKYA